MKKPARKKKIVLVGGPRDGMRVVPSGLAHLVYYDGPMYQIGGSANDQMGYQTLQYDLVKFQDSNGQWLEFYQWSQIRNPFELLVKGYHYFKTDPRKLTSRKLARIHNIMKQSGAINMPLPAAALP